MPSCLRRCGHRGNGRNPVFGGGSAGRFFGGFTVNCGNATYSVNYYTPESGVILYSVQEIAFPKIPAYEYKPKRELARQQLVYSDGLSYTALVIGAAVATVCLVGGSSVLVRDAR